MVNRDTFAYAVHHKTINLELRGSNIPRQEGFGRSRGQTSNKIIEAPKARSINNTDNDNSGEHYMFQVSKSDMQPSADVFLTVEGIRCEFMIHDHQ